MVDPDRLASPALRRIQTHRRGWCCLLPDALSQFTSGGVAGHGFARAVGGGQVVESVVGQPEVDPVGAVPATSLVGGARPQAPPAPPPRSNNSSPTTCGSSAPTTPDPDHPQPPRPLAEVGPQGRRPPVSAENRHWRIRARRTPAPASRWNVISRLRSNCRNRSRPTDTLRSGLPVRSSASLWMLRRVNGSPSLIGRVMAFETMN